MSEEQAAPEETTSETLLDASTPELGEGEYFLSDGIKGTGETPEWYKGDKYKSVAEQAKAYTELEKKFGGFTGAPKDVCQLTEPDLPKPVCDAPDARATVPPHVRS